MNTVAIRTEPERHHLGDWFGKLKGRGSGREQRAQDEKEQAGCWSTAHRGYWFRGSGH